MRIEVLLFASLAEAVGRTSVQVEVAETVTVGELTDAVARACPALQSRLSSIRVAIDHEFGQPDDPVPPNAEVALIPPVSGG